MKLIEFNLQPTDRQLRQFGLIFLVAAPALAWLWGANTTTITTLALVGLLLAVVAIASPTVLKPLFLALTIVATPIGMVIGELAMLTIYFLLFLPFGLAFRISKRDSLQLRIDKNKDTYWQPKKQPVEIASYYRQS
ncbi:MAG: hypothetical protein RIK87_05825 [Fuerstiella sp.]